MKDHIVVEQFISAPPYRVWEHISTPEGLAQWWRPGDIAPTPGHEFTIDMDKWGDIRCRVLEVVENRELIYRFGDWELRWYLTPCDGGTKLRLEHHGFDLQNPTHRFAFENMGPGWKNTVLPRLADTLKQAA